VDTIHIQQKKLFNFFNKLHINTHTTTICYARGKFPPNPLLNLGINLYALYIYNARKRKTKEKQHKKNTRDKKGT
ncbi:MAG: hypothetical protein ACR2PX_15030, partial [Endozoicomonas sp.]|uniref:hypothetical protein n=1 Tax=Endozoicomonas sp. TaxID=1892382 RepID=UPI003D9ACBE2